MIYWQIDKKTGAIKERKDLPKVADPRNYDGSDYAFRETELEALKIAKLFLGLKIAKHENEIADFKARREHYEKQIAELEPKEKQK